MRISLITLSPAILTAFIFIRQEQETFPGIGTLVTTLLPLLNIRGISIRPEIIMPVLP